MTQEEFKKLWEANSAGSGITFDDIADRAKEWGLFDYPKRCDINIIRYEVLKAAKCVDAEEFNPYKNDYIMKIEIEYNGSLAACRVNGKPFNECDVNEQVFAMNAFRTIIKDWERQNKQLLP